MNYVSLSSVPLLFPTCASPFTHFQLTQQAVDHQLPVHLLQPQLPVAATLLPILLPAAVHIHHPLLLLGCGRHGLVQPAHAADGHVQVHTQVAEGIRLLVVLPAGRRNTGRGVGGIDLLERCKSSSIRGVG